MASAIRPHRAGGEFFVVPDGTAQRRYETLRAYFVDGLSAAEAGARFGYTESTVAAMARDFRAGDRDFFVDRRPGPRVARTKQAARDAVLALRAQGQSIDQITAVLAHGPTPLNRTGVWEICREEGLDRLATRRAVARTALRERQARTRVIRWPDRPIAEVSAYAGVLLLVPALVELDLPAIVDGARLPGTREVPALGSVLSLLALKMIGARRVSHVDDVAVDAGLSAFAGLESLPKATALGTYSYRLSRRHSKALLAGIGAAARRTGQAVGTSFDLDFHAIMHFGDDVALETHYVPRRSQRTELVLTFFAQDGDTHNLVYANATCTKATQANEALVFARHWRAVTGAYPALLVFDSKVTTGAGLGALDADDITFLTLRARNAKLTKSLEDLPDSEWTTITLDRRGPYRRPQIHEDTVSVRGCAVPLRQIAVRGLGHEHPTLVLTNDHSARAAHLVDRYAKRMTIEQRLEESIRSFHLDALSSAVALNVDLDTTLTVAAQLAYDWLRRRLPGYETGTPDTIWRRFISTKGSIILGPEEVVIRLGERTYSPVLRAAELPSVTVPWWEDRPLRYELPPGKRK
jgi:DNA-directed RNA polymerase specialized sigma24 family protein